MSDTPDNEGEPDPTQGQPRSDAPPVVGPQSGTGAQSTPADAEGKTAERKRRWTNDPGIFWLTLFGLLALVVYTYYTRQLVIDAEMSSAQQAADLKTSFEKTDRAIAATNRLADQAAISAGESGRLAEQAEQSASATRELAKAAFESAAQSLRLANAATRSADAASRATEITRQLARSASQANDISQRALIGVQRPFMFVQNITVEPLMVFPPKPVGKKMLAGWIGDIQWENSGNTPTKDLTITTHCLVRSSDVSDPFAVLLAEPGNTLLMGEDVPIVFGPKQVHIGGSCIIDVLTASLGELFSRTFGITHSERPGTQINLTAKTSIGPTFAIVGL